MLDVRHLIVLMTRERTLVVAFWTCFVAGLLWYVRDGLVGVAVLWFMLWCPPHKGAVVESWHSSGQPLEIRIDVHQERCGGFVPGIYLCYWSRPDPQASWSLIMELRNDDPIPAPSSQVRYVSNAVAYCYFAGTLASTADGGHSWRSWNAQSVLSDNSASEFGSIQSVNISADGAGVMTVNFHGPSGDRPLDLATVDSGATWAVVTK